MKLRFAALAPLALFALACDSSSSQVDAVCTEFSVGGDTSTATFGVSSELQPKMRAIAAATSDLSAQALSLRVEVGAACRTLGAALGMSDADLSGPDDGPGVEEVCKKVGDRLRAAVRGTSFERRVWAPRCVVDVGAQVSCEGRCQPPAAACRAAAWQARCPADAVRGVCSGACDGPCEPSGAAPVACEGSCDGACAGDCKGERTDTGACFGTCKGDCYGACRPSSPARCGAVCTGTCSVPLSHSGCDQPLTPSTCGDADCDKSCAVVGVARAVCEGGGVSLRGPASLDGVAVVLDQVGGAFARAAIGYGPRFKEPAADLSNAMAHVLSHGDALGRQGGTCGFAIAQTGATAGENLRAAVRGSRSVLDALN